MIQYRVSLLCGSLLMLLGGNALAEPGQNLPPDIVRGADLFKANCSVCHPAGGNNIRANKPLKGAQFSLKYSKDAQIGQVIRSGIKNTAMPAFGRAQISDQEMKDLIAYIRSLG